MPEPSPDHELSKSRFRWRVIPGSIFYLCGAASLLITGATLIALASGFLKHPSHRAWGDTVMLLGLQAGMGAAWFLSGRWWWRGQWRVAMAATVLGYALAGSVACWV